MVFHLLILLLLLPPSAEAANRNVLLLLADDIGVTDSAIYDSPGAPPTPNLQALADRGLLYTNVWANPVCVPTRGTIYTGRYGFRTGLLLNPPYTGTEPAMRLSEITISEALGHGWSRAHIGKWHVSSGSNDPGLQGWPYYAGPPPHSSATGGGYYRWPKWTNGTSQISTTYATTDQVNEAIAAIDRATAEAKPYYLEVAFNAPHGPFHRPPLELLPPKYQKLPRTGATDRQYFEAMMAALDTEIGRLLAHVDFATTTVIYLADNGTPGRNLLPPYPANHGKTSLYQPGLLVPMIVAGAAVVNPGRRVASMINTVDIYPTVLALAGAPPAAHPIDGVSFLATIDGSERSKRDWVFAEVRTQRAIADGRYKLISTSQGKEFYDLVTDPLERHELLARGPLRAKQQVAYVQLRRKLAQLLASSP